MESKKNMHCKEDFNWYLFCQLFHSLKKKSLPKSYAGWENHRDYNFKGKVEHQNVGQHGLDGRLGMTVRDGQICYTEL